MDNDALILKIKLRKAKIDYINSKRESLKQELIDLNKYREYLLMLLSQEEKTKEPEFVKRLVLKKPFMGKMLEVC